MQSNTSLKAVPPKQYTSNEGHDAYCSESQAYPHKDKCGDVLALIQRQIEYEDPLAGEYANNSVSDPVHALTKPRPKTVGSNTKVTLRFT
jgi:hypothetical protein